MSNKPNDKKIKPIRPMTTEKVPDQQVPIPVSASKKTSTPPKK